MSKQDDGANWRELADALTVEENPDRVIELAKALSKVLRAADSTSLFLTQARPASSSSSKKPER